MFARLHRRFILITVALLSLVLIAVFVGSVASTWQTQKAQLNAALDRELQLSLWSSSLASHPFILGPTLNLSTGQLEYGWPPGGSGGSGADGSNGNSSGSGGEENGGNGSSQGSAGSPFLSIGGSSSNLFVPVAVVIVDKNNRVIAGTTGTTGATGTGGTTGTGSGATQGNSSPSPANEQGPTNNPSSSSSSSSSSNNPSSSNSSSPVTSTGSSGQVTIDADLLTSALNELGQTDASGGLLLSLGLAYQRQVYADGSSIIAFASTDTLVQNTSQTALFMGLICLAALLVILGISILLGRLAMRPAVEAWGRQQRFIADASHELKTPLAVVLANTDILLAGSPKPSNEQLRWLNSSQIEARRMEELVRSLLELARIDQLSGKSSGRARPAAEPVNLSDLVQKALLQFEAIFFERQIGPEVEVGAGIIIQGVRSELEQLLFILLDNAGKYTEPAGWVRVRLESERSGHARLTVANSGQPIAPEKLPHLCERFYRGDEAHGQSIEGFGLGLALGSAIVEAHRASLHITSDAESGTVVAVEFK